MIRPLSRLLVAATTLLAVPLRLPAQATVEYLFKAGDSALSAKGSSTIAGCNMDSALFTCLSHYHPQGTIVGGVIICLLAGWLLRK